MANFAELSIFNKLLLQKMKRMEEEHKKKYNELNECYYSLRDLINDQDEGYYCCDFCNRWFDGNNWGRSEDGFILDEDNCEYCCGDCVEKGDNTWLKKCVDCDDIVNTTSEWRRSREIGWKVLNPFGEPLPHNNDVWCNYCYIKRTIMREWNNKGVEGNEEYIEDHITSMNEVCNNIKEGFKLYNKTNDITLWRCLKIKS